MGLLKRTYALPRNVLEEFERAVGPGKRSAIIAEALNHWLEGKHREQLRREVIEGCHAMADLYLEIEQQYHPLEEEASRAAYSKAKAGGRRSGSSRSGRGLRAIR